MPLIPGVPSYKRETDSGNMAFLAAQAALSVLGVARGLPQLAGASGDAFKFVYDRAPIFEPLRDLRPWDSLARACAACGLRAEWVPDATLDHVRGQVSAHAAIGQPVLTSNLPGGDYHGFFLLVGYDEDDDTLRYQQAHDTPASNAPYGSLKLSDSVRWDGPVAGPPHWASFPLLVIRGPLYDPPDEAAQRREALQTALDVLDGEAVAYGSHPGAQAYASVPLAGRAARQGLVALDHLALDLAEADLSDFATIWRLDAQLGQLAWDRELAALYLESWAGDAPADLIAQYQTIAHTARTLLARNWERRSASITRLRDLQTFIEGTAAYVYALPSDPQVQEGLRDQGKLLQTPWGAALLVETPKRREGAVRLARRLLDRERDAGPLLKRARQAL